MAWLLMSLIFFVPNFWSSEWYQLFAYPKWIFVDLIFILGAIGLFRLKKFTLPSKPITVIVAGLLACRVVTGFFHPSTSANAGLNESIAFGILIVFFMNKFPYYLDLVKPFLIGTFILMFQGFFIASSMGNINILAEYLILLLPLAILFCKSAQGKEKYLVWTTTSLMVFVLAITQCRSAWIGIALIAVYELRKFKKTMVFLTLSFVVAFTGYNVIHKRDSTGFRFDVYKSAVTMLKDNPLGIGGGNFQFNFIPYQLKNAEAPREAEIYASPHDEFLKWGIEEGWMFLAFAILFWTMLGYPLFNGSKISGEPKFDTFIRCAFLVTIPQLLFQFPFDNPATILILALNLSYMLSFANKSIGMDKWLKIGIGVFLAGFILQAVCKNTSRWLESQHTNEAQNLKFACELDDTNWRACFLHAMKVVTSDKPEETLPILQNSIRNRPFDYHALRAVNFYFAAMGDERKACEVSKVYNFLLSDTKMFKDFEHNKCKDIPLPIHFENPKQFTEDYKKWLGL